MENSAESLVRAFSNVVSDLRGINAESTAKERVSFICQASPW